MCAFVQDTNPENPAGEIIYKTSIVVTVNEVVKTANGQFSMRSSSWSHIITIKFKQQIVILSNSAISVFSPDTSDITSEIDVTSVVYSVESQELTVSFSTVLAWPYRFAGSSVGIPYSTATIISDGCVDGTGDVSCEQNWMSVIPYDSICNNPISTVTFNTTIIGALSPISYNITLSLSNLGGGICGSSSSDDELIVSPTSYSLGSYENGDITMPLDSVAIGDRVYFIFAITNTQVSVDSISLTQLTLSTSFGSVDVFSDSDTQLAVVNVNATTTVVPVAPGTTSNVLFSFVCSRDVVTALGGNEGAISVKVNAVVDIEYHGNTQRKRSVLTTSNTDQIEHFTHIIVLPYNENDDNTINDETMDIEQDTWLWSSNANNGNNNNHIKMWCTAATVIVVVFFSFPLFLIF